MNTSTSSTIETLPVLATEYSLAAEQRESYQRDGHVLLRDVAARDEIAPYRRVIVAAAQRYNTETRGIEERDTYGKAFLQIMNLWAKDEAVKRFTLAHRFAHIAAQLMGVEKVRIYHDQALFKEAGGGFTPWHQDQHYWPLDTNNTITMWMPLVDASEDMGTMRFASGSHRVGYLGDLPISDESEQIINDFIADKGFSIARSGVMHAGDATFHSGWTLHGAPGNSSETRREVMTVIYFADGARVIAPQHANHEDDIKWWLPGLAPKDLAASALNPLVP